MGCRKNIYTCCCGYLGVQLPVEAKEVVKLVECGCRERIEELSARLDEVPDMFLLKDINGSRPADMLWRELRQCIYDLHQFRHTKEGVRRDFVDQDQLGVILKRISDNDQHEKEVLFRKVSDQISGVYTHLSTLPGSNQTTAFEPTVSVYQPSEEDENRYGIFHDQREQLGS